MAFNNLAYHFICFFLLFSLFQGEKQIMVEGSRNNKIGLKPKKLFVFGDSYADTGNSPISSSGCWKSPYGITFPGKPTGRCSDGRVFTDYFSIFLGMKTPIAFRWRKAGGRSQLKYGMNFAVGGTGVFDTVTHGPNMTTQIDLFQDILAGGNYTERELSSSVAHVSVTGNDHTGYIKRNGSSLEGFPSFIKKVVDQVETNLKRIHGLGVKKVAVTSLQPLGCLPTYMTDWSIKQCNATLNALSQLHNQYLQQAVAKLNAESKATSFVILDFSRAFWTVFKRNQVHQGSPFFPNPFKRCCVGKRPGATCGSVDAQGVKMYTVCADPGSSFFWDGIHVTQMGWNAVYSTLAIQTTLKQL